MININKKIARIRLQAYLLKNRLHFLVQIKKTDHFFKLIISEKYKKWVKFSKYLITILGLVSSLLVFPSILLSFFFALILFLIQSFIEATIFSYVALYIQPMPEFQLHPEKWLGMSFGYAINSDKTVEIPTVAMLFDDETYARKVHNLIRSWNYGEYNDKDRNIKMSVILRGNNEYVFFVYPSINRKTVEDFFTNAETERKQKSLTDVQFQLLAQLILGKGCRITSTSYLPTFIKRYKPGVPFYFQVFIYNNGNIHVLNDLKDILIHNLKIKNESDLTRKDIEYDIMKTRFAWDD